MTFKIETLSNRVVKGGAFVTEETFVVVDEAGELVVAKQFKSEAEAQAQIDGLGNLAVGLEFAKAQFPGQADKALKGKAAIIAAYLDWEAAGRPVKELEEKAAEGTEGSDVAAPADEPVLNDNETF